MTQGQPVQFRSSRSNRLVVPGWTQLVPNRADTVELQLDVDPVHHARRQAALLIEFWAEPGSLTLQALLPMRAFASEPTGWCVFLPQVGLFVARAIDPEPNPPLLAAHMLDLTSEDARAEVLTLAVDFPVGAGPKGNLSLNS